MGNVFVEAVFKNGETFSKYTIADLWIVKVQNRPHEIVAEISGMLYIYRNMHTLMLEVGGGNLIFPGCIRRPDTAVSPQPIPVIFDGPSSLPRLIFEVE
jgi:hypothetical protein